MFSSASLTVAAPPVANTIAQRVLACTGCLYNFAPATVGSPRPFGMPPFATELSDDEVAQLLSFVRGSWGNRAAAVSALEVGRYRSAR